MRRLRECLVVCALAVSACQSPPPSKPAAGAGSGVPRGGDLVVSIRTEPRTFNSLTVPDTTTEVLASLMQAKLVRINRVTDDIEPWLAEGWTRSDDGLRYTIKLRPNVTFSDGQPLTSGDASSCAPRPSIRLRSRSRFHRFLRRAFACWRGCRCCRATSSKRLSRAERSTRR